MKHRSKGKKLNRATKHRQALRANLMASLLEHGQIKTTQAKAKYIQADVEKLITKAKTNTPAIRRDIAKVFGKKQIANHLVDVVAPQFKSKTSGYTRIVNLGKRQGDDTMMARIELIDYKKPEPKKEVKTKKAVKSAPKKSTSPKKDAPKKAASKKATTKTKKEK